MQNEDGRAYNSWYIVAFQVYKINLILKHIFEGLESALHRTQLLSCSFTLLTLHTQTGSKHIGRSQATNEAPFSVSTLHDSGPITLESAFAVSLINDGPLVALNSSGLSILLIILTWELALYLASIFSG